MTGWLSEDTEQLYVHDCVPRSTQSERYLLNEIVYWIHILISQFSLVKINAFFCDFQNFQVRATKTSNCYKIMSPNCVTYGGGGGEEKKVSCSVILLQGIFLLKYLIPDHLNILPNLFYNLPSGRTPPYSVVLVFFLVASGKTPFYILNKEVSKIFQVV